VIYKKFLYSFFTLLALFGFVILHSQYSYHSFDNSKALDMASLTTLPYLAFSTSVYGSRFDFDGPKKLHPQMPQIQYKRFVYDQ
jgi:hypothetical protein